MAQLIIRIIPHTHSDDADLFINERYYLLQIGSIKTEQELRTRLADEPDYVYQAVAGLLQDMSQ